MYNAMKEEFEEIIILGKPAILSSERISRWSVPHGYHLYEIQRDDIAFGGAFQISSTLFGKLWGSIITLDKIDLPSDGCLKIKREALIYNTGDCGSMEEFMEKYPPEFEHQLLPTHDKDLLFFQLDGEAAERHGAIGHMRVNFGEYGQEFLAKWFDSQKHLKTPEFMRKFNKIIHFLRGNGQYAPFASRRDLEMYCAENPGKKLTSQGNGYLIRTEDYSLYFRCLPHTGNYDVDCYVYDNRYLLPELAGQHELPETCFSIEPRTGDVILIDRNERKYSRHIYTTDDLVYNRELATANNLKLGVTRTQEEAMLSGCMIGWNIPAAKPWNYEEDGTPRKPPKRDEPER